MTKKEMAIAFLKMAAGGDVRAAYEKFIASEFIHLNQYFKGDRESLLLAMEEAHRVSPNKSIETRKAYVDGDTVVTHSIVERSDPNAQPIVVVHIFRFQDNKVVELWDLGQELMKDAPNENGPI